MVNTYKFRPPYTLAERKGKLYVCITVPSELRPFYASKQVRRSTGTIDKAVANERAAQKYSEILADLDEKATRLDPFIEGLRQTLQSCGVNVAEWYTKGTLTTDFHGKDTIAYQLSGQTTHTVSHEGKIRVVTIKETHKAEDYADVAELITRLGYSVPKHLIEMLPEEQQAKVHDLTAPSGLKASVVLENPSLWASGIGAQIVENVEQNPLSPRVEIKEDVSVSSR